MEKELSKKEKDWILKQVEVMLESYRAYNSPKSKIKFPFSGLFDEENLSKKERDIMQSIVKKLKAK